MATPDIAWPVVRRCECGHPIAWVERVAGRDNISCLLCHRKHVDKCEWIYERNLPDHSNEELMKYLPNNKISLKEGYGLC